MSVQWADPPPIGGPQDPRAVYMERLRLLVDNPGRWAIIRSGTPSAMNLAAGALRNRQYNIPPGLWEFRVRTFRRGVHVGDMSVANLYARFVGCPEDWVERWKAQRGQVARNIRNAVFDGDGRRVCAECHGQLERASTQWPSKCDACWRKENPKWLRRRARLRERNAS